MLASQARRTPGSHPHANDHRLTPPVAISETVIREVGHHIGAEKGWHRELCYPVKFPCRTRRLGRAS